MSRFGALSSCWVKLSGFPIGSRGDRPTSMLEHLGARLRAWFPLERRVWGSDWPVVRREGGYAMALQAVRGQFTDVEASRVMSANTCAVYGL